MLRLAMASPDVQKCRWKRCMGGRVSYSQWFQERPRAFNTWSGAEELFEWIGLPFKGSHARSVAFLTY
ncbi:hypothetical protein B9J09_10835 [Xylella fastidiosa subsp. pauca]|nr:hypothetical protein B9J09_10835 [Xylella fastidiosa subsp. pauca]AVI21457.1 hypothetical protein BCV75_10135 [Xylella fastidiosa]AVI23494.1 hypothetical protein BC375_10205 [Xylella fastidiosa]KIA58631.1 hypothetical protein RA12_03175 [Xylella fastidiosa]KXB10738.1 hypothetical protein ADT32_08295 [Xylella fastidiosa]